MTALLIIYGREKPYTIRRYERSGLPGKVVLTDKLETGEFTESVQRQLRTLIQTPEAIRAFVEMKAE